MQHYEIKPGLETRYPNGDSAEKDAAVCVSVFLLKIDHLSVGCSERGRLDPKYRSIRGHAPLSRWSGLRRSLFVTTLLFDGQGEGGDDDMLHAVTKKEIKAAA